MRQDYQLDRNVRLLRRVGRIICWLIAAGLVLGLGWKIAEVSEARAVSATREHLASSLSHLAAEHVARTQVLDTRWVESNPFALLRWQQSDYCGELRSGESWRSGCWYWLPELRWILYQPRFGDGWTARRSEMQVYRVQALPDELLTGSQSTHNTVALELQAVSQAEISAQGWLANERAQ